MRTPYKSAEKPFQRKEVKALQNILGDEFKCLDDGFVRLVDYMGSEESIVRAARVSYGKGTKSVSSDAALIRYLINHGHTTPLEMVEFTFHVRVPMDCWRQWIRTRTANVNEYSTRYSEAIDSRQTTSPHQWRLQSSSNKQGSEEGKIEWPADYADKTEATYDIETGACMGFMKIVDLIGSPEEYLTAREKALHEMADEVYKERLLFGIAREQARKDLPLSTYTEAYWKIDLHNLLKMLSLRLDSHAQFEIRSYFEIIGEIIAEGFPNVWAAHCDSDFRMGAIRLLQREVEMIADIKEECPQASVLEVVTTVKSDLYLHIMGKRAYDDFVDKVRKLRI